MLPSSITAALAFLACASATAWLVALMREKGLRPARRVRAVFRDQPVAGRVFLAVFAFVFWVVASSKPPAGGNRGVTPVAGDWEDFTPITSTNTTRTLEGDDFRCGFVMARIGTDEVFDFSAPSDAAVCEDWRAFGAAEDWFYVAFTNWAFRAGTNDVDRLRIHSDGWIGMSGMPAPPVFWPLKTSLAVVPEANWHLIADGRTPQQLNPSTTQPSQFWHFVTPSNTLQATWQNILLDGDTNAPVSVQAEFWTDGRFAFRYDLSRCGGLEEGGAITNVRVGAGLGGLAWTTNAIPTNVTSLVFLPISPEDAVDLDADDDGLPTIDELFVHGTDSHNPDSDHDGLTDYEELFVHHTDPLNAYSTGGVYSDGFALRIGGEDPFAYPEGSTNTVLEHVFYSGTTNGAFAYPQPSDGMAVLRVSVSGSGAGDLVVGSRVVPLVAPPQTRTGPPVPPPTLLVQVAKGETHRLFLRGSEELDVVLDSDDFAFGVLPAHGAPGHVNFPNTVATPACIHDFNARRRRVSLPIGRDADAMACTWEGSMEVSVSNIPPRSATITGSFSARSDGGVTYTLSHPRYLFGQTSYEQTVRFCPRPPDPDPDDPDPEEDPPWYDGGEGDDSESGETGRDDRWCCFWGTCDGSCGCGDAGCCGSPSGGSGDEEDFDEECPVHSMPYAACAGLHASAYTNAVENVQPLGGVLYIRDPPLYEQMHLDVSGEHRHCCPCPDHWTNYVGVAYKSYRLRLTGSDGLPFRLTGTSCDVGLAGVRPSSAVGDATLAFSRNGEICQQHANTVLGVAIKGDGQDLPLLNALAPGFGCPMTVCTNRWDAPELKLVTNVKLPGGNVHLELAGASGQFAVWYLDRRTWTHRKLLDSATTPVKDLSIAYWKALMRRGGEGASAELPIYITSSTPGHVDLTFRYWNVIDGKFVQDEATQRITSVRPPLRLDITRDGSIDDGDIIANLARKSFCFWTNEDFWKNDDAFDGEDPSSLNVSDLFVNGRNDLINLLPVAVDISPFIDAWGNSATFRIRGNGFVRYATADVDWEYVDQMHIDDCLTTVGGAIRTAPLTALSMEGATLGANETSLSLASSLTLLLEAAQPCSDPVEIVVEVDGKTMYSYRAPLTFNRVRTMYRWFNRRGAAGGEVTDEDRPWEPVGWPDADRDGGANGPLLVFVHGYNVAEWEARAWSDGVFKRLWWSGMNAKFAAVAWRGDEGQIYFPSQGLITPNYQVNVEHAFATAPALATLLNALPGDKYILAHSLGNMFVSSAIHDHGLHYAKYFMLNAAVPVEAYDVVNGVTAESKAGMTHPEWVGYPDRVRAAHWWELFPDGDGRRTLTWKGRFANVTNTVNYYSSEEEVLADGNGTVPNFPRRDHAWSDQELWKGNKPFTDLMLYSMGRNEGGWSFNSDHDVYEQPLGNLPLPLRRRTPDETTNLTDAVLRECPFFGHFGNRNIYASTNGTIVSENAAYRAQLLADAIPAESFAVGANPVPLWNTNGCVNVNMASRFKDDHQFYKSPNQNWIHSFFLMAPYMCIHGLYDDVVSRIPKETSNE